jgi:plasmid stabilization system protein ParE
MDGSELLRGGAVAVVTLVVLVSGLVVVGFVALFRRRGDRGIRSLGPAGLKTLTTRAGVLLVRLDDALRDADEELGYAIAQFGPERARAYGQTVAAARADVAEAFRLKQGLDDAYPDSDRERREWTNRIITLCERADAALKGQDAAFAALRRDEVNAAGTLADVRARIDATTARLDAARATIAALGADHETASLIGITGNPDAAATALAEASRAADAAEPGITATGVSSVADGLQHAAQAVRRADGLLDAVERVAGDLAAASAELESRRAATRKDLVEAKKKVDAAPDAETGAAILAAITRVDGVLASRDARDPIVALDELNAAIEQLDLALAGARNQQQRLSHARAAYESTLVLAHSQIAAARSVIGGASVTARTRLAEAERQLALAQVAADPVEALDTVRRAVTHARDAEDLARYDGR